VAGGCDNLAGGGTVPSTACPAGGEQAILGGLFNHASGDISATSGGNNNHASGSQSSIGGGDDNTANTLLSSVSGGRGNFAGSGTQPALSPDCANTSLGGDSFACVAGGTANQASGFEAAVSGGNHNTASGEYSWAAGGT
jgi:hypothetical protein